MTDKEKKNERFEATGEGVKVENRPDADWESILKKYEKDEEKHQ